MPAVSVVMATRDRPALLRDALRSVARQTLPPLEVRIADDGATPLDPESIATPGLHLVMIRTASGSAAAARNRAAHGARGEVLAFLDDDDRWEPGHLAELARAFDDPKVEVAYRDVGVVRESVEGEGRIDRDRRVIARDWDPRLMRTDDYLPPSALAVRRSHFEALGGFDESLRYSEDWDLLLRAAAHRAPLRVPGVSVEVRLRETGNASSERGPERQACLDRLSQRHGLPRLAIKTFWEVAEAAAGRRAAPAGGSFDRAALLVVGAGAAGTFAALEAARHSLPVRLIERAAEPGGQLRSIHGPLTGDVEFAGRSAAEAATALTAERVRSGAACDAEREAVALDASGMRPAVELAGGGWIEAEAVLIATGLRRRRLGLPGEVEWAGRGVSTSGTRDRDALAGRNVMVVGAGDGAYENALLLAGAGCRVTLVQRGEPRANAEFRRRVEAASGIEFLPRTRVTALLGDQRLRAVRLATPSGVRERECSALVVKIGWTPNSEWCSDLEREAAGYVRVDASGRTSAARVWAAGDVARPGSPTLLAARASVRAAIEDLAREWVRPLTRSGAGQ